MGRLRRPLEHRIKFKVLVARPEGMAQAVWRGDSLYVAVAVAMMYADRFNVATMIDDVNGNTLEVFTPELFEETL